MKKEIKKYEEINKKITSKLQEMEENDKQLDNIYHNCKIDIFKGEKKQELDNLHKQEKDLKKDLTILKIQKVLVSNNIVKLFIDKYNNGIIEILKKYENKNIGDKTTEKIEEEIKDYLNDLEVEYIYFRLNKNNYNSEYNLGYLSIEFNNLIKIKYEFKLYSNYDKKYNYYDIINIYQYNDYNLIYCSSEDMIFTKYEYIEDVKKQATYIYNLSKKQKEKFEKLKEEMKEIRNNLNDEIRILKLNSNLMEDLEIEYKVLL